MTALRHEVGTQEDLLAWLDDHDVKYEVVDGMVLVSPPPTVTHERLVMRLIRALDRAAVPGTEVFASGVKVFYSRPDASSYVYPDVSVVRTADADEDDAGMRVPPRLVVEVLSPSTRRKDQLLKTDLYAQAGVPSYWLLDPATRTLTVLELQDGSYVETARGSALELAEPFPVRIDLR